MKAQSTLDFVSASNRLAFNLSRNRQLYYAVNYARFFLPRFLARRPAPPVLTEATQAQVQRRLAYYLGNPSAWDCSGMERWTTIADIRKERRSFYLFDLNRFARSYPERLKLLYLFGDVRECQSKPTIVKSRPIGECANSVILRLNYIRHTRFIIDNIPFEAKKSKLIWRGAAYRPHRQEFLRKYLSHPLCDVAHVGREIPEFQRAPRMSVADQLKYRYILSLEGNDVATNLKWIMSSNSLCLMPRPKFETWFMEGTLVAGKHYVEVRNDYSDLPELIAYYNAHPAEALAIIQNAHEYVNQFLNLKIEYHLCHLVLDNYFRLTGQTV